MIRPASQADLADFRQYRLKKFRQEQGNLIAEGHHLVEELSRHPHLLHTVFVHNNLTESLPKYLSAFNPDILRSVTTEQLRKITDTETPQPVLAIVKNPWSNYQFRDTFKRILYLMTIQDPGNMGTMIRTAAWFGWDAVITSPESADWTNTKVIRSTAAAFLHIPVLEDQPDFKLLKKIAEKATLYQLDMDGMSLQTLKKEQGALVLIIGNEARGFSTPESINIPASTIPVHIPGFNPKVESLNAGIAAGIALHRFSND